MKLDNQQERLAFLAGMIEGEGTITIQRSNVRKNGKQNLLPVMQIANSNKQLVDHVVELLDVEGTSPYVYWKTHQMYATSATVHVGGYKRLSRILPKLIPYLVSKRPHAELVLSMCERRKDLPKNTPYTEADFDAVDQIRELNLKPSVKMRQYPQRLYVPRVAVEAAKI